MPTAAHAATTFTVDRDSDDPALQDCTVPGDGCTLRGAVHLANATPGHDTIVLGARTIALSHGEGDLDVSEELTIRGAGSGVSVIDGSGLVQRILSADEGTTALTLESLRLTGGRDGALDSEAHTLVISNSRIDDSVGSDEIVEQDPDESPSTLVIRDSQIVGNLIADQEGDDELEAIVQFDPGSFGGTMVVERSRLTNNEIEASGDVGGVLDFQPRGNQEDTAVVRVTDSVVSDNEIGGSGVSGLRISTQDVGTVDVEVVRSTFERNTRAGAIGFYPVESEGAFGAARAVPGAATLLVTESTFDGNVSAQGGAIDISPSRTVDSSAVVTRSTFVGNRAVSNGEDLARGGAINIWDGALTVENSTFSGNVVEGGDFGNGGGAIAVSGGAFATLTHVTITGNLAEGRARGGGIAGPRFDNLGKQSFVPVTVTNSIVAGNQSEIPEEDTFSAAALRVDDCDASVGTLGGNLEGGTTCGFRDASDKQNADPKLAALAANGGLTRTHALAGDSPALNMAVASKCAAIDQRGIARVAAACDSGAYELAPPGTQPATQPPAAGGVLGEQASNECLSVRRFKIRLRVPRGEKVRKAVVKVDGERVKVRRGKRLTAIVDLRGLEKSRYKVKITLHLKGGGKVSGTRRYWTCTPAIRWTKPPKV